MDETLDLRHHLDALHAHRWLMVLMVLVVLVALADALVIGAQAGAVFLVVRAGGYGETDILESVRRLNQANQLWLPLPR